MEGTSCGFYEYWYDITCKTTSLQSRQPYSMVDQGEQLLDWKVQASKMFDTLKKVPLVYWYRHLQEKRKEVVVVSMSMGMYYILAAYCLYSISAVYTCKKTSLTVQEILLHGVDQGE